jgi:hypothetical protein
MRERKSETMRRTSLLFILAACCAALLVVGQLVNADSNAIDFESYTPGSINGQDGWSSLGSVGSGCAHYDHAVSGSLSTAGFGLQSLRISNAVTSGCFGDQTFSKSLVDEAGEADSTASGYSGGARQPHFEVQFDFATTMLTQQPGLVMSIAPDRGDGSRMSYLRFEDDVTGIDVVFADVPGTALDALGHVNFVETRVANNLSRGVPHTAKLSIDYYNGPSNDVVKVYIDGILVHTGTTWENYFRYDVESSFEQSPRTTDCLIFRTGGAAAPGNSGEGFLFDNLRLASGAILIGPPTDKDQCKNGGWKLFNNPSFSNQGACVSFVTAH